MHGGSILAKSGRRYSADILGPSSTTWT